MLLFANGWSEGFDGPGRRWVLYLKGCNLRCRWCTNPEGLCKGPEILFYPNRGRRPDQACVRGAVRDDGDGCRLERRVCEGCLDRPCITQWRHPAFELAGCEMGPAEVARRAVRYRPLFAGDGGVTFGGGESTLQADEVAECLDRLDREGVHTAVETNAASPGLEAVRARTRLLICDLKCVDSELHQAWTGADNLAILENLRLCAASQSEIWIRVPLVTGMNDNEQEMDRIARTLADLQSIRGRNGRNRLVVEVLPLHHAGEPKYRALGRVYPMASTPVPGAETTDALLSRLRKIGLTAHTAGRHRSGRTL